MPFKATSTWFNLPLKSNPASLTMRLGQNIQRVKSLRDRKCGTKRQSERVCLRTPFPSIFYPRIQDIEREKRDRRSGRARGQQTHRQKVQGRLQQLTSGMSAAATSLPHAALIHLEQWPLLSFHSKNASAAENIPSVFRVW